MSKTKRQLYELAESADGPAMAAHWGEGEAVGENDRTTREYGWHHHVRGQLFCVLSGLVHVRTAHGSWLLPPHRASWMPPGERHTVSISGSMSGWSVLLAPHVTADLPAQPCVIGVSDLLRALVHHASAWSWDTPLDGPQERVLAVLLDEVRRAPQESLHLPMPQDRRLLKVARAVLASPHDNRGLDAWATYAGLSERSLSRLFRSETALSFAQWRQQARLARSLERLADGEPVASVADRMGYASVSAFVAMFRKSYGESPGRYFTRSGALASLRVA